MTTQVSTAPVDTAEPSMADPGQIEAFAGRLVGDIAATMTTIFCALGDKLGLFAALSSGGPATAAELAQRTATNERYVHEWLRGLTAAGYLNYDRATGRYALPAAHAAVLAEEGGVWFLAGGYQELAGMLPALGRIEGAIRDGGGVPQAAYPSDAYVGMSRFTRAWFEHRLLGDWLPLLPHLQDALKTGIRWADVGCGAGLAVIQLAQAFPASSFTGYDAFPAQVERAREAAELAGVGNRVRFEVADGSRGLPEKYDVISTFDVVHDAADPAGLVAGIRRSLTDDGSYLWLEINCADDPADNTGPIATVMYGFSVLYCMTTSLAQGGAGLGTCGCPPAVVEELGHTAGFGAVRELPIGDPFNRLYELRPGPPEQLASA
jgi:SAM-dependent methyltransferase